MPRQEGNYENFLDRIQNSYSPSEVTYGNVLNELGKPTSGRRALAQEIARTGIVSYEIENATTLSQL